MRKDLGVKGGILPMPVLMISTFDSEGKINVMNAAWATMLDMKNIIINLANGRKTLDNIKTNRAFIISIADSKHVKEADYFGIVSGNKDSEKFSKTNLNYEKSKFVNAPIILEFPIAIECKLIKIQNEGNRNLVFGEIVNTSVDENVLNDGKIDTKKINALIYDTFNNDYYQIGSKVAKSFSVGKSIN